MINEWDFILEGISKRHFSPSNVYICGNKIIKLNKNLKNKNTKYCFRCTKSNCHIKYIH